MHNVFAAIVKQASWWPKIPRPSLDQNAAKLSGGCGYMWIPSSEKCEPVIIPGATWCWYIYLHLVHLRGIDVGKYTKHGASGYKFPSEPEIHCSKAPTGLFSYAEKAVHLQNLVLLELLKGKAHTFNHGSGGLHFVRFCHILSMRLD